MRIVLDTNVLVSGIFFQNTIPSHILNNWLEGKFHVYATPKILAEYIRVIDRISLKREPAFEHHWQVVLPKLCHIIADERKYFPVSRDPFDDKFIFCAIRSKSQYLITGDMDLKVLSLSYNFKIVSPREFINLL